MCHTGFYNATTVTHVTIRIVTHDCEWPAFIHLFLYVGVLLGQHTMLGWLGVALFCFVHFVGDPLPCMGAGAFSYAPLPRVGRVC